METRGEDEGSEGKEINIAQVMETIRRERGECRKVREKNARL
jgi:hypothetical protein